LDGESIKGFFDFLSIFELNEEGYLEKEYKKARNILKWPHSSWWNRNTCDAFILLILCLSTPDAETSHSPGTE
jgi:hypothetical protein